MHLEKMTSRKDKEHSILFLVHKCLLLKKNEDVAAYPGELAIHK